MHPETYGRPFIPRQETTPEPLFCGVEVGRGTIGVLGVVAKRRRGEEGEAIDGVNRTGVRVAGRQ